MRYDIHLEVGTPDGKAPTMITHGSVCATVEADTPEEALRLAGEQGVDVLVTPEMLPTGDYRKKLQLRWRAEPARG